MLFELNVSMWISDCRLHVADSAVFVCVCVHGWCCGSVAGIVFVVVAFVMIEVVLAIVLVALRCLHIML